MLQMNRLLARAGTLGGLAVLNSAGCVYTAGQPNDAAVGATQGAILGGVAGTVLGAATRHPLGVPCWVRV